MAKNPKIDKTNAMRILDRESISYEVLTYEHKEHVAVDGETVAGMLGLDPAAVFKTLVTKSNTGEPLVFVIPVAEELDLKEAAASAGVKSVSMIHVKELHGLTGYERGGCSPLGMKKPFRTFIDFTAEEQPLIMVSGGRIGLQVRLSPDDLLKATCGSYAILTR